MGRIRPIGIGANCDAQQVGRQNHLVGVLVFLVETGAGSLGGLVKWKLVWAGQARPYMCVRFEKERTKTKSNKP